MAAFVATGGAGQHGDRVIAGLSRSVWIEALKGIVLLLARVADTRDQAQLIREVIHRVSESRLAFRRDRVTAREQGFRRTAGRVDRTRVQHLQTAEVGQLVVVVTTECPVQLLERGAIQAHFFSELTLLPGVVLQLRGGGPTAHLDGVLTDVTTQTRDGGESV